MRGRTGAYDPHLLDVFSSRIGAGKGTRRLREVALGELEPGMVLGAEVRGTSGSLLVPAGHRVTRELIEKLHNLGPGAVKQPLLCEGAA
jgi:hypothetical protein